MPARAAASSAAAAPDLHSPRVAAQALAVFERIADAWQLSTAQRLALLGLSKSALYRHRSAAPAAGLDAPTLERLSYVFRIHAALNLLLPIPERAHAWVRAPNTAPLFGGASALDRMTAGRIGDLKDVADYLDAQRGGDFA